MSKDETSLSRMPERTSVLVVDDDRLATALAGLLLGQLEVDHDCVVSGEEALEACFRRARSGVPYDIVFMDIGLPGIDGHETAERLRSELGESDQPWIVGVTSSIAADDEERQRCQQAGMNDFYAKPTSLEEYEAPFASWWGAVGRGDWKRPGQPDDERASVMERATAAGPTPSDYAAELDLAQLEILSSSVGGEAVMKGLVEELCEELMRHVSALSLAADTGDRGGARRAAHALVGSAGLFGLRSVVEAARRVLAEEELDVVTAREVPARMETSLEALHAWLRSQG